MPYHVSVKDQSYRVLIVEELDKSTARHLADWLEAARLNPGARFEVDLSEARWVDQDALRRLLVRHGSLASERRLAVTGHPRVVAPRLAAMAAPALLALEPIASGCS